MGGFLDGIDFIDYYRQMDKIDGMGTRGRTSRRRNATHVGRNVKNATK